MAPASTYNDNKCNDKLDHVIIQYHGLYDITLYGCIGGRTVYMFYKSSFFALTEVQFGRIMRLLPVIQHLVIQV